MKQSVELKFWKYQDEKQLLKEIEELGRNAYQSFENTSEDSCFRFINMIINRGHIGLLEHHNITFKIITNRAVANELVRHRIAAYVQESTRYVNYGKETTPQPIFISQTPWDAESYKIMVASFETYNRLVNSGVAPQHARDFLPLGLKTAIYATMNIRSWFHFYELRSAPNAHPMMQELAKYIMDEISRIMPTITISMIKKEK
jgi:thymidylate synthase (FAD)